MSDKALAEGHDPRSVITDPRSSEASDPQSQITDPRSNTVRQRTVLAIASAGGHWVQLRRLHPAFAGSRLLYATTRESYRDEVETDGAELRVVPDCNRWEKIKLLKSAFAIFRLLLKEKPDVIVTTGAAPGYFALRIGKLLRKQTIWIDSIANAEELSMSGQKAKRCADLWITQWQHLAQTEGPLFFGNVLGDTAEEKIPELSFSPPSAIQDRRSELERRDRKRRIFVTVGTDLPFDRLVKAIDDWAAQNPQYEIFAQIGETSYQPRNIPYCKFIEPPEFKRRFQEADIVVSHAGMGTILSSLSFQKPLLVLPRIAAKGEHRNEHQLATAKHLSELNKINVAQDEAELVSMLQDLNTLPVKARIGPHASAGLVQAVQQFLKRA